MYLYNTVDSPLPNNSPPSPQNDLYEQCRRAGPS